MYILAWKYVMLDNLYNKNNTININYIIDKYNIY